MELRKFGKRDKSWGSVHTLGFEERSATEISTSIRLVAAAAREWEPELGFITCSLDVKQAFDNVSPLNWSLVMKEMNNAPILAGADRGKYNICLQETRITDIPFDKSIKQGGKESPSLFNLMVRSVFRTLQKEWKKPPMGGPGVLPAHPHGALLHSLSQLSLQFSLQALSQSSSAFSDSQQCSTPLRYHA